MVVYKKYTKENTMKRLILIASILAGFSAAACPNLAGSYNCTQKDDLGKVQNFSLMIIQNGIEFNVSTDGNAGETLIADGVTRDYDTVGQTLDMTLSCSSSSMTMDMSGEVSLGGEEFVMSSNTTMTKSNGVLTQNTVTKALGNTLVTKATCKEI
jgi:hypothetical protein